MSLTVTWLISEKGSHFEISRPISKIGLEFSNFQSMFFSYSISFSKLVRLCRTGSSRSAAVCCVIASDKEQTDFYKPETTKPYILTHKSKLPLSRPSIAAIALASKLLTTAINLSSLALSCSQILSNVIRPMYTEPSLSSKTCKLGRSSPICQQSLMDQS